MTKALDTSEINALLKKSMPPEPPKQYGPMRRFDREMRCASKGCGSSTYLKLQGIPYCTAHTLIRLNNMLVELGVES